MSIQDGEGPSEQGPDSKRRKQDDLKQFFRSWAWKREHRPDKDRFHRPYKHSMAIMSANDSQAMQQIQLSIQQKKFTAEGFASTVWDSSIVTAKYIEKWPRLCAGKRCLDLSAGCGLVAVVMAKLGALVTATDLEANLQLLKSNCTCNGVPDVIVAEHRWGQPAPDLLPTFDVICACDVMYVQELVAPLLSSLLLLSHPGSLVLVAHGRNRPAEAAFIKQAEQYFSIAAVPSDELDDTYQCSDVDVLRLRCRAAGGAAAPEAAVASAAAVSAKGGPS